MTNIRILLFIFFKLLFFGLRSKFIDTDILDNEIENWSLKSKRGVRILRRFGIVFDAIDTQRVIAFNEIPYLLVARFSHRILATNQMESGSFTTQTHTHTHRVRATTPTYLYICRPPMTFGPRPVVDGLHYQICVLGCKCRFICEEVAIKNGILNHNSKPENKKTVWLPFVVGTTGQRNRKIKTSQFAKEREREGERNCVSVDNATAERPSSFSARAIPQIPYKYMHCSRFLCIWRWAFIRQQLDNKRMPRERRAKSSN